MGPPAVATITAGPLVGILALRLREVMKEVGARHFMAGGPVLVAVVPATVPASMVAVLITDPRLALADHLMQAKLGLLIGLLILVVGGIALAVEGWFRRAKIKG